MAPLLTNLPAAQITGQLTASQLSSNLTLGGTTVGTFSGDGSALTNTPGVKYNLQQVALLKWGVASFNNSFSVGANPFGVCFDGSNVWVSNTASNNVMKLNKYGATIGTFGAGGVGPAGICFDGVNIWVANQNSSNVTKMNADTGAFVATYSAGNRFGGIIHCNAPVEVFSLSAHALQVHGDMGVCFRGTNDVKRPRHCTLAILIEQVRRVARSAGVHGRARAIADLIKRITASS